MRRILVFLATMVMGVLVASGVALAAVVSEVEPNDSIAGAQEIAAASFDLTANTDITASTGVPHATVNGGGNAGTGSSPESFDFYSFTVPAGDPVRVNLDIDHTTPDGNPSCPNLFRCQYDPWIELYDTSGTLLALSDDNSGDPGSTDDDPFNRDSFIATTLDPGTYVVAVGANDDLGGTFGPVPDTLVQFAAGAPYAATYQLHVSVGNPPPDTTPPSVKVFSPVLTAFGPTANVTATFSEKVQGVTKSTFFLERVVVNKRGVEQFRKVRAQVSTVLVGSFNPSFTVTMAILNPAKDLQNGTYQATVTTGVTDLAGNPLDQDPDQAGNQSNVWRFTVGSPPA
jgi:hypothetical protein